MKHTGCASASFRFIPPSYTIFAALSLTKSKTSQRGIDICIGAGRWWSQEKFNNSRVHSRMSNNWYLFDYFLWTTVTRRVVQSRPQTMRSHSGRLGLLRTTDSVFSVWAFVAARISCNHIKGKYHWLISDFVRLYSYQRHRCIYVQTLQSALKTPR